MPIEKILVPTDFSANAQIAFEKGYDLARQLGAKLYVLHVQDETTLRIAVKEGLLRSDSTQEELQAEVEQLIGLRFSQVVGGFDLSRVPIEQMCRRGDPKAVIVDCAREIGADLVVVGMSGVTAKEKLKSAVLGSVAESVMRKSPCPTLVVRVDHNR